MRTSNHILASLDEMTYHDLVDRLGVLAEVVPEHGRVVAAAEVGSGVPLLSVWAVSDWGLANAGDSG
jgi:hypothetical protein